MPTAALIRFPVPFEIAIAVYESRPDLMQPIMELIGKHGLISHETLIGDGEFMDIDVFPSREAHAAFKAEAAPHIAAYEEALGASSVETVWETAEAPAAPGN